MNMKIVETEVDFLLILLSSFLQFLLTTTLTHTVAKSKLLFKNQVLNNPIFGVKIQIKY